MVVVAVRQIILTEIVRKSDNLDKDLDIIEFMLIFAV